MWEGKGFVAGAGCLLHQIRFATIFHFQRHWSGSVCRCCPAGPSQGGERGVKHLSPILCSVFATPCQHDHYYRTRTLSLPTQARALQISSSIWRAARIWSRRGRECRAGWWARRRARATASLHFCYYDTSGLGRRAAAAGTEEGGPQPSLERPNANEPDRCLCPS